MASGQIDPARLQGDALRRWYLRSPVEIENERRLAAAEAYDAFFSRVEDGASRNAEARAYGREVDWPPIGHRTKGLPAEPIATHGSKYQLTAPAGSPGFWDHWSIRGCSNCHGYTPETLPPIGGHSPFPPIFERRGGRSDGSAGARWSDRPQCNQQFEADRKICQNAKSPQCWENSNRRLSHCSSTGEVGIPPLMFGPPNR
jgi:hypothetical protein